MKKINLAFVLFGVLLLCSAMAPREATPLPVYLDDSKSIEARIEDALRRMTLEEKVAMCHAQSKFSSAGVPRLGIPEVWCSDGPHGIREEVKWDEWQGAGWTNDSCIAFPALTCLAATWNPEMSAIYGKAIGEEARYRNKNVLLGPGVNIYRTPLNGRNFEYMGEDPYLAATMVVPYVQEVQSSGVAACVKHFALNNQEEFRHEINVNVSDRALYEIYLPAFEAAIKAGGAWAIMGSYNRYKEQHCCHNQYLLNDILKNKWQFDGVVVSDWGGVHNTMEAALNGLDMEYGSWTNGLTWGASNAYDNYFLAQPFLAKLRSGEIPESVIDDKARRILRLIFRTTMDRTRPYGSFGTEEHGAVGRRIAEEGIVLLRNEGNLLPLDPAATKQILVVGENAVRKMTVGGGSSSLKTKYEISPLQGMQEAFGPEKVVYRKGYSSKADVEVEPLAGLIAAAKTADAVVFFGGLNKDKYQDAEGQDRKTLELPYGQDQLISALRQANPRTVVVIISGSSVTMPWLSQVPAVVQGWYNGSETGHALAAVLTGRVNPSGKLPFTYYADLGQCGAHTVGEYPGTNGEMTYKDDIFVGYRWTEKQGVKPLFPFGHGLSYTKYEYGKASVNNATVAAGSDVTVMVSVKNSGSRAGAEVVQLYVSDLKSSVPRPVKELKGFQKVWLESGETKTVTFILTPRDLSFYDEVSGGWKLEPGEFKALVGASSADVRSECTFTVK